MSIASILIPVYNRENLIASTLRSAMAQTVQDIEIIVVDNKSTDSSYEVAIEVSKGDERVKLFQNNKNIGPVYNWIECVKHASSPYSKLLFSDDLISPTFIEKTLPHIISPECGLVYTPSIVGWEEWKGEVFYRAFISDCKFSRDFFLRAALYLDHFTPVSPGAALLRTEDLRRHILTELPGVHDYDFLRYGAGIDWLIYALTAIRYPYIYYIQEPLSYFRAHSGSITIANENDQVRRGYELAKQWFKAMVARQ